MPTLDDYITQVRRLVNDLSSTDWSDDELTSHINDARLRIALDTHCVRLFKVNLNCIANQETYNMNGTVGAITVTAGGTLYTSTPTVTFTGGNPTTAATATAVVTSGAVSSVYMTSWGAGYESAPTIGFTGGGGSGAAATATTLLNTLDVGQVAILWASWRTVLDRHPFGAFQAFCRANPLLKQVPGIWSLYQEQDLVYLFPIPDSSNQYLMEWDIVTLPDELESGSELDTQIRQPYADAVQFYASNMALLKLQNFEMAAVMEKKYERRIMQILKTRQTARVTSAYAAYWARFSGR